MKKDNKFIDIKQAAKVLGFCVRHTRRILNAHIGPKRRMEQRVGQQHAFLWFKADVVKLKGKRLSQPTGKAKQARPK